jgi:hypothetical protein
MSLKELGDGWYESEESTRAGLVAELQRIRRRFVVRPLPVLFVAALITGAITYKIAKKHPLVEAEVILALSEGQLGGRGTGVPADQLREYVTAVLLPDKLLIDLIEKRNMYPLRKKLGAQFAVGELREQIEINIWKNSFQYYDDEDATAKKSARIGITVMDADADQAYEIAHELASVAIVQHELERERISHAVSTEVKMMRAATEERLGALEGEIAAKQEAFENAKSTGKNGLASALMLDLVRLGAERKRAAETMHGISVSSEGIADQIAAAGLDLTLQIVEERRPERPEKSQFVLVMVLVVIGTGALIGAALLVGAFDSRIHDTDDVERLGLPVLGHVPGFAGDSVGSLHARGARRARVGSVSRWRSLR